MTAAASHTSGWVWGGSSRSTFDIIWSCMSIIIVCTYRVMHLNLPAKRETGGKLWQWRFWIKSFRKTKWMIIMALSPEIVISICLADWLWARDSVAKFAKFNLSLNDTSTTDIEKLETAVFEEYRHITRSPL
jgi:hypothetical protein